MEQMFMLQTQLLQQMAQNMQNNQNQPPQQHQQVRDKRGEFLKGRPPTFNSASDPLQADD